MRLALLVALQLPIILLVDVLPVAPVCGCGARCGAYCPYGCENPRDPTYALSQVFGVFGARRPT